MSAIIEAFTNALEQIRPERACMVISDLCGSTGLMFNNALKGAALQVAHEAMCSELSGLATTSPAFKAMGDGVMMEIDDPVKAARVALALVEESRRLCEKARTGTIDPSFEDFTIKVVVAHGEFRRAPGTQRWLGLLPTKATRIASFAREGEVWIDNEVALAIRMYLDTDLSAVCDYQPSNGAAFCVPLKGLDESIVSIHLLRRRTTKVSLKGDELTKAWQLPWPQVMSALKQITQAIKKSDFKPDHVVGIGRSGAILGGIVAGNLDHLPIDVIERRHDDPRRILSTITEPEEVYNGDKLERWSAEPRVAWQARKVLLVIGEAKTEQSFFSAKSWLAARGIREVRTIALVKSSIAHADWWWLQAENAWVPWQFTSGYDLEWPTYLRLP